MLPSRSSVHCTCFYCGLHPVFCILLGQPCMRDLMALLPRFYRWIQQEHSGTSRHFVQDTVWVLLFRESVLFWLKARWHTFWLLNTFQLRVHWEETWWHTPSAHCRWSHRLPPPPPHKSRFTGQTSNPGNLVTPCTHRRILWLIIQFSSLETTFCFSACLSFAGTLYVGYIHDVFPHHCVL